jgi:hypothetical protein
MSQTGPHALAKDFALEGSEDGQDGLSKGCEIKLYPNTAVIPWLKSDRLLIAAETVPVSICKCSGAFTAYEIHVPDLTIVAQYSQRETKKEVLESSRL